MNDFQHNIFMLRLFSIPLCGFARLENSTKRKHEESERNAIESEANRQAKEIITEHSVERAT